MESGERVVVGVNKYRDEGEEPTPFFRADNPALERAQVAKLAELKQRRDAGRWRRRWPHSGPPLRTPVRT